MGHFSRTLSELRAGAGWRTAYAFYHRNGGRRTFPFTYAYYAKIERGGGLPRPEWVPKLLALLRIPPNAESQRKLLLSYLKDLVGKDELFETLVGPLLRPHAPERPEKKVIKRLLSGQAYHVSIEQFRALLSSRAAYWAFNCVVNSHKPLRREELSEALGAGAGELGSALARLLAAKLVRRTGSGKFLSPLATRYCVFPRGYAGYEADLKKLKAFNAAPPGDRCASVLDAGVTIRASAADVAGIEVALRETLESASASSVYEPGEDTGMFIIDARIRRAFPF